MTLVNSRLFAWCLALSTFPAALAAGISVAKGTDLTHSAFDDATWTQTPSETVTLIGQPMALPKPKETTTSEIKVQSMQDGTYIAFRVQWKCDKVNEAGKLGEFSDAVALEFPVRDVSTTPVFMGGKDNPVHILHWRAQYQRDVDTGKPEMKALYPNMNPDMYPMEFKDNGKLEGLTEEKREVYSPGKAAGNPQSYAKTGPVDELFAEGFGSSAAVENKTSMGRGTWKNGVWTVVFVRPLKIENASSLDLSKVGNVGFAVWQGGKQEVGSRKSLTMMWIPLNYSK